MKDTPSNERELELVEQYLEQHFLPIQELMEARIPDHETRLLALRPTTRHIYHWRQATDEEPEENEAVGVGPDHPDYGEPRSPMNADTDEADERPPEEWATGENPATPWPCPKIAA